MDTQETRSDLEIRDLSSFEEDTHYLMVPINRTMSEKLFIEFIHTRTNYDLYKLYEYLDENFGGLTEGN